MIKKKFLQFELQNLSSYDEFECVQMNETLTFF